MLRMALSRAIRLSRLDQLLETVLAHRFQHPEARLTRAVFLLAQEAALDERGDAGKYVDRPVPTGDGLGRLECATASKDRKLPEHSLLVCSEQVVAPGNGIAHGALPGRQVAPAAGQYRKPLLEPRQQRGWRQDFHPGRGQ